MSTIESLPKEWRERGIRATDTRAAPGAAPETMAFFQCAADLDRYLSERKPVGAIVQIGGDFEKVKSDARALWAVRVLDAWTADRERDEGPESASHTTERPTNPNNGQWITVLFSGYEGDEDTRRFYGPAPDAARLAAARAVCHEIPADVRAELGECP